MIEYTLVRSRRKSIAIRVAADASVEVLAPLKMPRADIDSFVLSKEEWITANIERRKQRISEKSDFYLDYGKTVLLCGKPYTIREGYGPRAAFDGECFNIPSGLSCEAVRQAVIHAYRLEAKRILTEKTARYAELMYVKPTAVKVNSAKTRWGSCSGKNSVNFSWRIIMADEDVIDYVVVHELAHIKEHNHSPRFWAVVAGIVPDYERRRQGLKTLHEKLSSENWD